MDEFKGVRNVFIREIPEEKMYLLNMLTENGIQVEIEEENTFEWAIKRKKEELVKQLIPSIDLNSGDKPLSAAIKVGYLPNVKILIDAGAPVTLNEVLLAQQCGHTEVIKLLTDHLNKKK